MPKPKKQETEKTRPVKPRFAWPLVYPDVEVRLYRGKDALTVEQARAFLGWEEVPVRDDSVLLTDVNGKHVRCVNNTANREFRERDCYTLVQQILMRRWRLNGESMIVGKYGETIDCQHRLIALVLAEQVRTGKDAEHWREFWDGPVTMETVMVLGVDESDDVVNTINTGIPRSFADVMYRSEYFSRFAPGKRRALARIANYAIRMLWSRTGANIDAFAPRRTHAEGLDFIERHGGRSGRLLKAVAHVHEENDGNAIGRLLSPGYAAGLLYLMGCCSSDPAKYANDRTEKSLDWKHWDKAQEFWVLLAKAPEMEVVREALAGLNDPEAGTLGRLGERVAVVVKAWNEHVEGRKALPGTLELAYGPPDDDGIRQLVETPVVGGIDLGNPEPDDEGSEGTPEEVEARKAEVAAAKAPPKENAVVPMETIIKSLWEDHPGKVLLFKSAKGHVDAFGRDAAAVAALRKDKTKPHACGLVNYRFDAGEMDAVVNLLLDDKREVAVVEPDPAGNVGKVTPVTRTSPEAKVKPTPKSAANPSPNGAKPKTKPAAKPGGKHEDLKAKQLAAIEGPTKPKGEIKF